MKPLTEDELLEPLAASVAASARRLDVSVPIVYRAIRQGHLPAFKLGRRTLIATVDLERFVEALKSQPFVPTNTGPATEARHSIAAPPSRRDRPTRY